MDSKPLNPKFPEQNADGVDLSLIRSYLRLTPTERIRRGDAAARGMEALRKRMPRASQIIFERLKAQW